MSQSFRSLIGLIIISVGVVLLIGTLGIDQVWGIDINFLLGLLWPLVLIFLGLLFWSHGKQKPALLSIFLGIIFLLSELAGVGFWYLFWPLLLIGIGLSSLAGWPRNMNRSTPIISGQNILREEVYFAGLTKKITSLEFAGGKVTVAFGGAKIDLRDTMIAQEGAQLELDAFFGGIEVLVPTEKYRVISKGEGVAGGWEDKFTNTAHPDAPLLTLTGTAVFGGIAVKNND